MATMILDVSAGLPRKRELIDARARRATPWLAIVTGTLTLLGASAHAQQGSGPGQEHKPTAAPASGAKAGDNKPQGAAQPGDAPKSATSIDIDELADHPDSYLGKRVKVQSEVEEVLSPRAFTLDEDSWTATNDILVLLPHATTGAIGGDAKLQVTGTVRKLDRAAFKKEYSWFDFATDLLKDYDQHTAIVADAISTLDGKSLMSQASAQSQGASKADGQSGTTAQHVAAAEVARNPAAHYGRRISITSNVEDVLSGQAFTLDEDAAFAGPDVLVISATIPGSVHEGAQVRVSGTLRRFDMAELQRDYKWLKLDDKRAAAFNGKSVLVADSIARAPRRSAS